MEGWENPMFPWNVAQTKGPTSTNSPQNYMPHVESDESYLTRPVPPALVGSMPPNGASPGVTYAPQVPHYMRGVAAGNPGSTGMGVGASPVASLAPDMTALGGAGMYSPRLAAGGPIVPPNTAAMYGAGNRTAPPLLTVPVAPQNIAASNPALMAAAAASRSGVTGLGPNMAIAAASPGMNSNFHMELIALLSQPNGLAELQNQLNHLPPHQAHQVLQRIQALMGGVIPQVQAPVPTVVASTSEFYASPIQPPPPANTDFHNDLCIEFDASESPEPVPVPVPREMPVNVSLPVPTSTHPLTTLTPTPTTPLITENVATGAPQPSPVAATSSPTSSAVLTNIPHPASISPRVANMASTMGPISASPAMTIVSSIASSSPQITSPDPLLYESEASANASASPDMSAGRRPRVFFTPFQNQVLECVYFRNSAPTLEFRRQLADRLNLSESQLTKWFYRRRQKSKSSGNTGSATTAGQLPSSDPAYPFAVEDSVKSLVDSVFTSIPDRSPPLNSATSLGSSSPAIPSQVQPTPAPTPNPFTPNPFTLNPTIPVIRIPKSSVTAPDPASLAQVSPPVAAVSSPKQPPPPSPNRLVVRLKINPQQRAAADSMGVLSDPVGSSPLLPSDVTGGGPARPVSHFTRILQLCNNEGAMDGPDRVPALARYMLDVQGPADRTLYLFAIRNTHTPDTLAAVADSSILRSLRVWAVEALKQENEPFLLTVLETVAHLPMNVDRLQATKWGVVIKVISQKKAIQNPEVAKLARSLYAKWQAMAQANSANKDAAMSSPSTGGDQSLMMVDSAFGAGQPATVAANAVNPPANSSATPVASPAPTPAPVETIKEKGTTSSYLDQYRKLSASGRDLKLPSSEPASSLVSASAAISTSGHLAPPASSFASLSPPGSAVSPNPMPKRTRAGTSSSTNVLDNLLRSMTGGKARTTVTSKPEDTPTETKKSDDTSDAAKRIAAKFSQMNAKNRGGFPAGMVASTGPGRDTPSIPAVASASPITATFAPSSVGSGNGHGPASTQGNGTASGFAKRRDSATTVPSYSSYRGSQPAISLLPAVSSKRPRTGRKVWFATDDELCQVKEFYRSHPADFSVPDWSQNAEEDAHAQGDYIDVDSNGQDEDGMDTLELIQRQTPHEFGNARDLDRKEGLLAFRQARRPTEVAGAWYPPRPVALDKEAQGELIQFRLWWGKESVERDREVERERKVLSVNYPTKEKIPASPASPVPEVRALIENTAAHPPPKILPFMDSQTIQLLSQSPVGGGAMSGGGVLGSPLVQQQQLSPQYQPAQGYAQSAVDYGAAPMTVDPANTTAQSLSSLMEELAGPATSSAPQPAPLMVGGATPEMTAAPPMAASASNPAALSNLAGMLSNPQLLMQMLTLLNGASGGAAQQQQQQQQLTNTQAILAQLQTANLLNSANQVLGQSIMGATPNPATSMAGSANDQPYMATQSTAPTTANPTTTTTSHPSHKRPHGGPAFKNKKGKFRHGSHDGVAAGPNGQMLPPPPAQASADSPNGSGDPHNPFADYTGGSGGPPSQFDGPSQPKWKKNIPCKFFFGKGCQRGESCGFSHERKG